MSRPSGRKSFFRSESERNVWIRLNAERLQYSDRMLNREESPMGGVDEPHTYMWISRNQLDYDEHQRPAPRFSLEELLLSPAELFRLEQQLEEEELRLMLEQNSSEDDISGWQWH
jgi:hypothetical protein